VVAAHAEGIDVACGDGSVLRILEIQSEGRRPMPAKDFLAGYRLDAGTRFGPA
jgi:methionyl-tRNA formyltransferase